MIANEYHYKILGIQKENIFFFKVSVVLLDSHQDNKSEKYILNQIPNAPSKILKNISKTNQPKMFKFVA